MSLKDSIKPISYLKANAAKVIEDVSKNGKDFIYYSEW
jgi:hypothetical protein